MPRTPLLLGLCSLLVPAFVACSGGGDAASGGAGGQGGEGGGGGQGEPAPLTVDAASGPITGELVEEGAARAFLGIPYAEPPVGELRWKRPVPRAPWAEPLDATKLGKPCTQLSPLGSGFDPKTSEDCLTLNVWTPSVLPASGAPLPVMVWIHGGGFVLGSSAEAQYDGRRLASEAGAVVVSLNYRLGPMGFLALPELAAEDADGGSTGNYGLEDQRLALAWVKENAAAFGGDPSNVTIFGESAGGMSVCDHLVSPGSAGLFHRAIIQSGPCTTVTPLDAASAQGAELAAAVGCADLACLRQASAEVLWEALPSGDFLFGGGASWGPVLDGAVLPDHPGAALAKGDFAKVPVMVGSNADEATLFFTLADATIADEGAFAALAEQLAPGFGDDIVAQYPTGEFGSAQAAAEAAIGDAGFVCPSRRTARAVAAAGESAFVYHFTHAPSGVLFGDGLGAFHSAEIRYVFRVPGQLMPYELDEAELGLSDTMIGYWSRMAASGDPNGAGATPWPVYDEASDVVLGLNTDVMALPALHAERCDFWDTLSLSL